MRFTHLIAASLICAAMPTAYGLAQESPSPARTDTRAEIERILNADSASGAQADPRQVAEFMTTIPQGGAPEDFWEAYQSHVRAWEQYAALAEASGQQQLESAFSENLEELAAAETAIEMTFAEVERIARRYGARLPAPQIDVTSVA